MYMYLICTGIKTVYKGQEKWSLSFGGLHVPVSLKKKNGHAGAAITPNEQCCPLELSAVHSHEDIEDPV